MERLNIRNFFENYMLNPDANELTSKEKNKAWAATIILGILTLGIAHAIDFLITRAICPKKNVNTTPTERKASQHAQKILLPEEPIRLSKESQSGSNLVVQEKIEKPDPLSDEAVRIPLEKTQSFQNSSHSAIFDELNEKGYSHLYDHLMLMTSISDRNNGIEQIEKMTFSEISKVILETREIFIQKVKRSINNNSFNNTIVFLLGSTGVGKSTTLCYLRGDKMILKGTGYESETDQNNLIGHALSNSCTFFPNVHICNDLTIVDFPGFEDSRGPLVNLGIELALKALVQEYNPKILVLASLTDTESRYGNIAKFGQRLDRLVENKENCILGITQYSRNVDFNKIIQIEEQLKQNLLDPTPQEIQIRAGLDMLTQLLEEPRLQKEEDQKKLKQQKEMQEKELQILVEKRLQNQQGPLVETPEIIESRIHIKKIEDELLQQIGLKNPIRFSDLENSANLEVCLNRLSDKSNKGARVNTLFHLDATENGLLDKRFELDLMHQLDTNEPFQTNFNSIQAFHESVSKHSLIYTITSKEIGSFLHLPEMDPKVVKKYDREIIDSCIQKYKKAIIGGIQFFEKKLKNIELPQKYAEKIESCKSVILGLEGIHQDTEIDKRQGWEKLAAKYEDVSTEEFFKLPVWTKAVIKAAGKSLDIQADWKSLESKHEIRLNAKDINEYLSDLEKMKETIGLLKKLENVIKFS